MTFQKWQQADEFNNTLTIRMNFAEIYIWTKIIAHWSKVKLILQKSYYDVDIIEIWKNLTNKINIQ